MNRSQRNGHEEIALARLCLVRADGRCDDELGTDVYKRHRGGTIRVMRSDRARFSSDCPEFAKVNASWARCGCVAWGTRSTVTMIVVDLLGGPVHRV